MTGTATKWAFVWVAMLTVAQLAAAQNDAKDEMPIHKGKGKVTEAVDTRNGAIFDIGGGVTILLPRGLPVGSSRVLTLKKSGKRPSPGQIQKGFQRFGETLIFTGTLATAGKPIIVALSVKKDPSKKGKKLVLAVEEAGLCTKENSRFKIGKGLCSSWRLVDAQYDASGSRLIAKLSSTGGHRLQFGLIPE